MVPRALSFPFLHPLALEVRLLVVIFRVLIPKLRSHEAQ